MSLGQAVSDSQRERKKVTLHALKPMVLGKLCAWQSQRKGGARER